MKKNREAVFQKTAFFLERETGLKPATLSLEG